MITTPSGPITPPTRREVLMSLGTLAIGIADWARGDFRRATGVVTRIERLCPELYGGLGVGSEP